MATSKKVQTGFHTKGVTLALEQILLTKQLSAAVLESVKCSRIEASISEVGIIDFSCADEVVAKLLQQYLADEARDAFFVFRGVREPHHPQVEGVLQRQDLAAVVEVEPELFTLVGSFSNHEQRVWDRLETEGAVDADAVERIASDGHDVRALESLLARGLAFRSPQSGRVHALSRLVAHLM